MPVGLIVNEQKQITPLEDNEQILILVYNEENCYLCIRTFLHYDFLFHSFSEEKKHIQNKK